MCVGKRLGCEDRVGGSGTEFPICVVGGIGRLVAGPVMSLSHWRAVACLGHDSAAISPDPFRSSERQSAAGTAIPAAGTCASCATRASLQHANGEGIRRLDQAIRHLPWPAAPEGHGRRGGISFSRISPSTGMSLCQRRTRRLLHCFSCMRRCAIAHCGSRGAPCACACADARPNAEVGPSTIGTRSTRSG